MNLFSQVTQDPENENENTVEQQEQEQTESKDKDGNSVFCKTRFDTRKQLNRGSKVISDNMVTRDGITIEHLESLGMPIFKYKTQITLHGIYMGTIDRVGDYQYKHIIVNQNRSIGIRYNAIDYAKKKRIYKMLADVKGYRVQENSTEFYAEKWSKFSTDKAEILAMYEEAKKQVLKINTQLFYGTAKAFVTGIPFMGYVAAIRIDINAIYEANVTACIENITEMTIEQCEKYVADKIAAAEAKRAEEEAERNAEAERIAELRRPIIEEVNRFLKEDKGMICIKCKINSIPLNTVFYTLEFSGIQHVVGKANILTKEGSQKYPRKHHLYLVKREDNDWKQFFTPEEMTDQERKLKSDRYGTKENPDQVIKIYIDREKWEAHKEPTSTSQINQSNSPLEHAGLTAIQYSDKSILIIANDATRAFTNQLSKVGKYGKWFKVDGKNTAGWICSAKNQIAIQILKNTPASN